MENFINDELIMTLLGTIVTVLIGVITAAIKRYTGIEVEKHHREALHEALMSGAASAVKLGPTEGIETLKAHAIAHAQESVPDALRALIPGDTVLDSIAERYAREALARLDFG